MPTGTDTCCTCCGSVSRRPSLICVSSCNTTRVTPWPTGLCEWWKPAILISLCYRRCFAVSRHSPSHAAHGTDCVNLTCCVLGFVSPCVDRLNIWFDAMFVCVERFARLTDVLHPFFTVVTLVWIVVLLVLLLFVFRLLIEERL